MRPAKQLASVVEQLPASIALLDAHLRYLAVSQCFISEMESIVSRRLPSPAEVVGHSVSEILPDLPVRWYEAHLRVIAGEELAEQEDFIQHEDGSVIYLRWSMKPWRTDNGHIGGQLLCTEVVTEEIVAKHALADSEARFRATFENAAVGMAHVGSDLRLLRANQALCRILGWPMDEFLTKSLVDISHPDDLTTDLRYLEQMRARQIDSYGMDKRYLRKDGTIVWAALTVGCVRRNDGAIDYLVAVVEDIAVRKRTEELLKLLMRESHHRTKNILSLVQAVARQTAASDSEHFVESFTERIQALATNHDLLVESQWQGADIENLVRVQLAHFGDLVGARIAMHGPRLRLNATAAQAIGLAVHELATNASKYGALSTDAGRVDVGWRSDAHSFAIIWTERDGPTVQPPHRRGFGTTVIELMAKSAVGGEVEVDYAPSGFGWHLTCPAANVLEVSADIIKR